METATNFWCGPCTTDVLSLVATIPQSGYVPGQCITIIAEVTNMSYLQVDYIKFSLRKIVHYKSHVPASQTKIDNEAVQERRAGQVEKMSHCRIEAQLAIPPIPPTNTGLCKVIDIAYEVKVEAKVSGPHYSPFVLIPITIGTIPLNRYTSDPKTPSISTASALPITEQPSTSHDMTVEQTAPHGNTARTAMQPIMAAVMNSQTNQYVDIRKHILNIVKSNKTHNLVKYFSTSFL